jgi:hypothetical protein
VVVVARECSGRTIALVTRQEAYGVKIGKRVVAPGSKVHADEAAHWASFTRTSTRSASITVAYSLDGVCTNQAENFLARLRRMADDQHHRTSPLPLPVRSACGLAGGSSSTMARWRTARLGSRSGVQ